MGLFTSRKSPGQSAGQWFHKTPRTPRLGNEMDFSHVLSLGIESINHCCLEGRRYDIDELTRKRNWFSLER